MFSENHLFKSLNKFKEEYLKKDESDGQDDEYLYMKRMAACELLNDFLMYYSDNPKEFNSLRKHFFYMAISTLLYSNFFNVFYHCLIELSQAKEQEWSEVQLEEFQNESYAKKDIEDFIVLLNKVKKYMSEIHS